MKKTFYTKIIIVAIIFSFIAPSLFIPKKAEAQGYPVYDNLNYIQNILNGSLLGTLVAQSTTKEVRESILNGLAWMFAKMIVQQLTTSVVNWINSGFDGSPSFVKNPGAFFLDLADQATGVFIDGELKSLCSPFSIDIRIALSFKYRPYVKKRYECTLGTLITNSSNAVKNASINGFTAGDFRQGGWPAFVSLTTEPQNNIYGAYLQADSELSYRVANIQDQKKEELNQGRGFLSWRDCSNTYYQVPEGTEGSKYDELLDQNYSNQNLSAAQKANCPISTPGSVTADFLKKHLDAPVDQLNLADSINEIVGALFSQLVTQVMSAGLGGVSGDGPSDSGSYLNQIRDEINGSSEQINSIGSKLISQVDAILKPTLEYRANKSASLNLFINVKKDYEAVQVCYAEGTASQVRNPRNYQSLIDQITSIITNQINPVAAQLLAGAQEADARVATLQSIRTAASTARTLNDLNTPSQQLSNLIQGGGLTSEKDILDSKKEYTETQTKVAEFQQDAQRKLQQCRVDK